MKAIELMQKLGELVVRHGDLEVCFEGRIDLDFSGQVVYATKEVPNYQDFCYFEIKPIEWK